MEISDIKLTLRNIKQLYQTESKFAQREFEPGSGRGQRGCSEQSKQRGSSILRIQRQGDN